MKQLFLIAVAVLVLSTGSTKADRRDRNATYRQSGQGGVFSRMMELERRKNARLREIFLRR